MLYLFCAFCGALSAAVQSVTGFGFAIVMMAVLPHAIPDARICSAVSSLAAIINGFTILWKYRKKVRAKNVVLPLLAYFPVSFLAISLAARADMGLLRILLGVCLILLGLYFIFLQGRLHIRNTPGSALTAGGLSGLLGGLFSTSGPPMVVNMLGVTDDMEEYIGCLQFYFMITGLYSSAVRAVNGLITGPVLLYAAAAAAAVPLGVFLGRRLMGHMSKKQQNLIIDLLLILSGILLLV